MDGRNFTKKQLISLKRLHSQQSYFHFLHPVEFIYNFLFFLNRKINDVDEERVLVLVWKSSAYSGFKSEICLFQKPEQSEIYIPLCIINISNLHQSYCLI